MCCSPCFRPPCATKDAGWRAHNAAVVRSVTPTPTRRARRNKLRHCGLLGTGGAATHRHGRVGGYIRALLRLGLGHGQQRLHQPGGGPWASRWGAGGPALSLSLRRAALLRRWRRAKHGCWELCAPGAQRMSLETGFLAIFVAAQLTSLTLDQAADSARHLPPNPVQQVDRVDRTHGHDTGGLCLLLAVRGLSRSIWLFRPVVSGQSWLWLRVWFDCRVAGPLIGRRAHTHMDAHKLIDVFFSP